MRVVVLRILLALALAGCTRDVGIGERCDCSGSDKASGGGLICPCPSAPPDAGGDAAALDARVLVDAGPDSQVCAPIPCPQGSPWNPSTCRCQQSDGSTANGAVDAGVVQLDAGFVCSHRNPQSGICDDPRFVAMCAAIVDVSACDRSGCWPIYGSSLDGARGCYNRSQFLECGLEPDGCSTAVTYGRIGDGGVWRFNDSCQGRAFTRWPLSEALPVAVDCP